MSYILDALRKADAQRERDPARGIHAQSARSSLAAQGSARGAGRPGLWAAAAAGVAAIALASWYLYREPVPTAPARAEVAAVQPPREVPAPPPAAPVVAAPVVPAPVVMPPPVVVASPVVVAPPVNSAPAGVVSHRMERSVGSTPPMPPAVGQAQMPAPVPAPSMAAPSVVAAPVPVPAPQITAPQNAAPPGMAPAPPPAVVPQPLPAAPPSPPVAGLPADAPKLVISGGVYSSSKAQRMLIVNGQVVGEGADLGSGVVVEEIKPKSAVLRFRGARYSVTY